MCLYDVSSVVNFYVTSNIKNTADSENIIQNLLKFNRCPGSSTVEHPPRKRGVEGSNPSQG